MLQVLENDYSTVIDLESCLSDGRLTEPSNGERYDWRKIIEKSKKVNRALTDEEMSIYKL